VLGWMPTNHPQRTALVDALKRTATSVATYQDKETGLWWQVMDKNGEPGNYLEASASSMFVYALAKGVRLGYLPQSYKSNARHGWEGIQKAFVSTGPDGLMVLNGTVKVGGLGGTPYRSGSFDYYVGEKTIANDAKGVGAFLLAGSEMSLASTGPQ
jgi:unsaturated rhamnogalacturonyl hydrolase